MKVKNENFVNINNALHPDLMDVNTFYTYVNDNNMNNNTSRSRRKSRSPSRSPFPRHQNNNINGGNNNNEIQSAAAKRSTSFSERPPPQHSSPVRTLIPSAPSTNQSSIDSQSYPLVPATSEPILTNLVEERILSASLENLDASKSATFNQPHTAQPRPLSLASPQPDVNTNITPQQPHTNQLKTPSPTRPTVFFPKDERKNSGHVAIPIGGGGGLPPQTPHHHHHGIEVGGGGFLGVGSGNSGGGLGGLSRRLVGSRSKHLNNPSITNSQNRPSSDADKATSISSSSIASSRGNRLRGHSTGKLETGATSAVSTDGGPRFTMVYSKTDPQYRMGISLKDSSGRYSRLEDDAGHVEVCFESRGSSRPLFYNNTLTHL